MSRPWTLPGAEYRKEKLVTTSTPAADDFDAIRANLERIKKEEEQAKQPVVEQTTNQYDDYYGCGLAIAAENEPDYSCNGTSLYEEMEKLLDENDKIISKYFPDPRIQKLIEKYSLKVEESHYPYLPNRVLP